MRSDRALRRTAHRGARRALGAAHALALAIGVAIAGCSDGGADVAPKSSGSSTPARLVRPALVAVSAAPRDDERRVVSHLEVPREIAPWTFEAKEARVRDVELAPPHPPAREVVLTGRTKKTLTVPLGSASAPFNRVELMVRINRADLLELSLAKDGAEVAFVTRELVRAEREQWITVDVPYPESITADRLTFAVGGEGPVAIGPIDLVQAPWRDRLPPPEGPPRLIGIGSDLRLSVGLSSARAMETTFEPRAGGVLAFAYGVPDGFEPCVAGTTLVLTLSADGRADRVERLRLDEGDPVLRWQRARVVLGELGGRRVRARFTLETGAAFEAVCAISEPQVFVPDDSAPLVLLITSDTHRGDHLGLAHDPPIVSTPALDALARRGIVFDECYSMTNVTIPSHAAILTGVHPRDTRITDNGQALGDQAVTLAECFRAQGFMTLAAVSANHLDGRKSGLGQGFDRIAVSSEPKRRADATLREFQAELDAAAGKPIFAWLHLFDAHTPYQPPPPFDRAYYAKEKNPYDKSLPDPGLDRRLLPTNMPGLRDLAYPRSQYTGEVSYLDRELGSLLASPLVQRAVVAFTGDHGESFGEHGVWWEHAELYPDTIHVPLILACPSVDRGARVATRVSQLDLGRTLLDLAGLEAVTFPGRSLVRDRARADADPVYTISAYGFSASMTQGRWHLILQLERHPIDVPRIQPFKERHKVELYDLEKDPGTLHDLSETEHARAKDLRAALVRWLQVRGSTSLSVDGARDAESIARLAALGYVAPEVTRAAEDPWIDPECGCEECERFR